MYSGLTGCGFANHDFHPAACTTRYTGVIARRILAVIGVVRGFLYIGLRRWWRHINHRWRTIIDRWRRPPGHTNHHIRTAIPAAVIAMIITVSIVTMPVIAISQRGLSDKHQRPRSQH